MNAPYAAEFTVAPYLHGVRIDRVLAKEFRNYTTFRMARLVRAGAVTIDGIPADDQQRVREGQRIAVKLLEPPDKLIEPEAVPLDVVAEDEWILVVNKPAGMVVHPVSNDQRGTLAGAVQHHLDRQSPLKGLLRPGIVHRLDRQTSGVLVIAKDHLSHRRLSIDFQRGRVQKTYLALVDETVAEDEGEIALQIGRRPELGTILTSAQPDAINARPARTRFRVVRRFGRFTLLEAVPLTGRIHQIRVHLAAIGHPVVGDEFYNRRGQTRLASPEMLRELRFLQETGILMTRQALHAERLRFSHPHSGDEVEFTAPLAFDFREAVKRLADAGRRGKCETASPFADSPRAN